jgi:tocopherol O-methyltransferase
MVSLDSIREHYDTLSPYYQLLWGQHIHHGYWAGCTTQSEAQIKLIEELCKQAGIAHQSRVLDVGCGLGGSSLWLAKHLNCSVTGITISPVQAEIARQDAGRESLAEQVNFLVMDANVLNFDPQTFDAAWIIECSEHLFDKAKFFNDCSKLLKENGRLALCTWLRATDLSTDKQQLIDAVCHGMLLPDMASMQETIQWITDADLSSVTARDITAEVEQTWVKCLEISNRPEIRTVLPLMDQRTKDFINSFSAMYRAYREGAMQYAMITAVKKG